MQKTRHSEAERWFAKAKAIAPADSSVRLHFGLFLLDLGRDLEAAEEFEVAANAPAAEYEAVFNAAVAYRLAGRNERALEFYRRAQEMRPEVSSGSRMTRMGEQFIDRLL